jgi:hypothetical protein
VGEQPTATSAAAIAMGQIASDTAEAVHLCKLVTYMMFLDLKHRAPELVPALEVVRTVRSTRTHTSFTHCEVATRSD